ncbi:uncharacterized protein LOC130591799 [Beta vulgaris subsp. vulgaris]|uniref:uncharacterized protein LOC130591799 n=1 Tax=Beta vulgaris subsp. vulgaris TaxID=3555 RepID=UPI002548D278|nr:uncharacterized protein LOC130591799 [Beta vulgaris subsp. vulgaris]
MAPSRRSIRTFVKNQEKSKGKEKAVELRVENEDELSTMSEKDLLRFLDLGNLLESTVIRNAEPDEPPESCPQKWVVLYEYPFKIGIRLPFTPLARDLMQIYQISPGQIMPQVWRILSVIDRVTASWEEAFTLHDLLLHYEIRVKAKNRIALHAKARLEPLVGGIQSNDRGWKNRFVFVKRSSLGEAGASLVGGWNTEGLNPKLLSHRDESQSLCDKFLKVPEDDRQFKRVLFASQDSCSSMASGSSQSRPRGSLDGQALAEMLRKRKGNLLLTRQSLSLATAKKDTRSHPFGR